MKKAAQVVVGLLLASLLSTSGLVRAAPQPLPTAIPVADIPSRATADDEILQHVRRDLTSDPSQETNEIAERLPSVAGDLRRLAELPESGNPEGLRLSALRRVRIQWEAHKTTLDAWEKALTRRSRPLEEVGETLDRMRRVWSATREAARPEGIPDALAERIESILADIDAIDSDRRARVDLLLTLQDRISRDQSSVNATIAHLVEAEQQVRIARFGLDREPLWIAVRSSTGQPSLAAQVRADWQQRVADFRDFVERNRSWILLHAGLFLVFLVVLLILRTSCRRQPLDDEALEGTRQILARPYSAALLFAIVATPSVYPDLPFVVVDVAVLAGLVSVLRVLPGLVGSGFRVPLDALMVLFVLDRLVGLADERTLIHRLLLLGLTGLALALIVWVLRSGRFGTVRGGPWKPLTLAFIHLAAVAYAVSLLANLIGAFSLARLLTVATFVSSYAALLLFAAALALEGLVVIALRSEAVRSLRLVEVYTAAAKRWTVGIVRLVLFLAWCRITLVALDAYDPVSELLRSALTRQWTYGGLSFSVGGILAFGIALTIGLLASRFLPALLQEDVLSRTRLPLGTRGTIAVLVRYGILVLAFLAAMAVAGIELGQFAIIAGALGVGIGFGLQELVNNIVSGLILAFERPIRMGDTVQVGELLGHVVRIGIRASVVRTIEGAEVIVPNGHLLSTNVINWTLSDRRHRLEVAVGVAYGTDPGDVLELLARVAEDCPRVLGTPKPLPLLKGFGDSSLDFVLRCWIADFEDGWSVRSEVRVAIHDALREAGIEIPFPQRDLHMRSADPASG